MSSDFIEKTKESFKSEDSPLGKQEPGAPFAVVALTYLVVLAISVGAIALVAWLAS